MNILNYARGLELSKYNKINESAILEADSDPAKALEQIKSGKAGGSYSDQWKQVQDAVVAGHEADKTTGTVMVKHTNGTDMVNVTWKITNGKVELFAATATPSSNSNFKLTSDALDTVLAKIQYETKSFNIDETKVSYIIEWILNHSTSNSFSLDTQAKFVDSLFTKTQKDSIVQAHHQGTVSIVASYIMAKAFMYPKSADIGGYENDDDCKYVVSVVGRYPQIASVNITDEAKIKGLAQSIFNIVDDTIVSMDEEMIACMGVVSLTRTSIAKLISIWDRVHKNNAGGKGLFEFIGSELDETDSRNLFYAMTAGIIGRPREGARAIFA
jgi:hypothetical protein